MTVGVATAADVESVVSRSPGRGVVPPHLGLVQRLVLPADLAEDTPVWGLPPEAFRATPAGVVRALVHASRREAAILGALLQPPRPRVRARIHRVPAPAHRDGAVGRVLRLATDGVVVQSGSRAGARSLFDVLLEDAGLRPGHVRLRPTRGGGVVAVVGTAGMRAMFRIGTAGAASDPTRGFAALEVLEAHGTGLAPRPLRHGGRDGLRWTLERWLPGRVGASLDHAQVELLAATWAELPGAPGPATAEVGDLVRIALLVPHHTPEIRRVLADVGPPRLPGVLRHGDLWAGNVLSENGGLTGVVDWGAWHPAGTPGADLLHLVALLHRRRGESLGTLWRREPWRWPSFRRLVGPVLDARDVTVTSEVLEHIGVAWWATAVAGTLDRLPHRVFDEEWIRENVTSVLRTRWAAGGGGTGAPPGGTDRP